MLNICEKFIQSHGRSMKNKLSKYRGFTIVEVLIAVAVMAILITAVMNGISGAKREARQKIWQTEVDKEALHAAHLIEEYLSSHPGSTPSEAIKASAVKDSLRKDPTGQTYNLAISTKGSMTLQPSKAVQDAGAAPAAVELWK